MNEALLAVLSRRFPAVAETLPRAMAAVESDDPVPFVLRYRRDLVAGIPPETFVRLRAAARDERDTERRRRSARRAQEAAGRLTEGLAKRIEESRDTAWLEDLARPAHKGRVEPEDPMTPVAREVLFGAPGMAAAAPAAPEVAPAAIEEAPAASGEPAVATGEPPVATEAGTAETAAAPAATDDAPAASDAATVATVATGAARPLDELLAPFCGPDGAHPTSVDQRARLVRLVAGLIGEDADARLAVRKAARAHGAVHVEVAPAHAEAADWKPFRDFQAPVQGIPGRKLLLLRRGQRMNALRVRMDLPEETVAELLAGPLGPRAGHPYAEIVTEAAKEALARVLLPAAASEILRERRRQAERSMFPRILQTLEERLLAPPAGAVPVVAVTPGATGTVRLVAVDAGGRATSTVAVHPFSAKEPKPEDEEAAAKAFLETLAASEAKLVAVGGSRRARAAREWVAKVLAAAGAADVRPVAVNEIAAAKWAETDAAKAEAPDLPASARVGLSLARSLQDPLVEAARWDLTEMVLDPNQRDLDRGELRRALDDCAQACVASVGADVNTAHAALLARVPGLGEGLAKAIVEARTKNGPFAARADVRHVAGMTEEAWQRAGAFLRVRGGTEPIDATGVHPTGMPVVHAIAAKREVPPADLIGSASLLEGLDPAEFANEAHTAADVASVIEELRAGTSDPRTRFVAPAFNPGVERLRDVQPGMDLAGIVTGLSPFGAFVDVGVRQSGLVHVSELAHDFVQDPAQVVQPGQPVRVKVLSVDPAKRRISLSMKALVPAPERPAREERPRPDRGGEAPGPGGPGGPGRPPRREGTGGPPSGFRRGPREDRPRAPLGPERPGTAPRRAGRGRRPGDDRRDGGGMFGGGRRDDRGGRGGRGREEPEEDFVPAKPRAPQRDLDPFRLQLTALSAQLGIAARTSAPPPAAPATGTPEEPKLSGKERRALRRAQARAAAPALSSAPGDAAPATPDAAPAEAAESATSAPSAPSAEAPPEPAAEPAPPAERPTEG